MTISRLMLTALLLTGCIVVRFTNTITYAGIVLVPFHIDWPCWGGHASATSE